MKYIDAGLLRKEIERQKHMLKTSIQSGGDYGQSCTIVAYDNVLSIIDSLQQEQPEAFDTMAFQKGVKEGRRLERDEPVTDCHDLERAAENSWAVYEYRESPKGLYSTCYVDGFKAGAEMMKTKMMEEAVEGEVEEWRSIVGYTNYEVSNTGKVLSRKQLKDGVLLKQSTNWAGYKYVTLHDDKYVAHTCFVHRLVAEAFVPNPENKRTVNHKNENKSDNRACNLEWATYIEQCSHGSMRGRITNLSLQTATDGEKKKFIRMRKYLRERGYIIDSDNLIAYWTTDTKRAVRMEKEPLFFQYRKYCGEVVPDYIVRSICRKEVERIDKHGNVKKYNSMSEAAKDNGVSISAIKRVLIGTNKSGKCNGYSFKYSKDLPKED